MLISADSQAVAILVGYSVGARDFDQAKRDNARVLQLFLPITVGIALALAVFARPLYGLLSTDPRVIALGARLMWIEVVLEIGRCLNIVLVRNLQAVGDVRFPVGVGILSQWIIAVGMAWVLGVWLQLGLAGVWLAYALDENLRGVIFIFRWRRGRWQQIETV